MVKAGVCKTPIAGPIPAVASDMSNFAAPWIVYVSSADGAILISAPEDSVSPFDQEVVDIARTPHVIGRGGSEKLAEADARRKLGPNWRPKS